MPAKKMDIKQAASELMPQDHACLIFSNPRRWHEFVVSFLRRGVAGMERCVYITALHGPDHMRHMLSQAHADLKTALDNEQLLVMHFSQVYTPKGVFEPEATVNGLRNAVTKALKMGYRALRVVGEMQWASYRPPGYARLAQYEAMLNPFFEEQPCLAVCQYDRALFSPRLMEEIADLHHWVVEA
jgi:KaiC/GvpD/RAD55 family RecA-like ATPase